MEVRYRGPMRGLSRLTNELREAGFEAEYEQPWERRGVGHEAVEVLIKVKPLADGYLFDKALDALARLRQRHPGIEVEVIAVEVEDDGDEARGT